MLSTDNQHLTTSTPAMMALHVVQEFHGQSSPELPIVELSELDKPLFDVLVLRWKRHYLGKRQRWEDRALFRSLNMATQAAHLPAGVGTTLDDLGRIAALWVSAFEILAHPRTEDSGTRQVYGLFENVAYLDRNVGSRRYVEHRRKKKSKGSSKPKSPQHRCALPSWLYGKLYQARNDFLHGNPVGATSLYPRGSKVSLFWLAPSLYRIALTGFLRMKFQSKVPKESDSASARPVT